MTLQWLAVSSFLYAEIVVTLLLILPFLKPTLIGVAIGILKRWKRIFNLRFFAPIKPIWTTTFYAVLVVLIFLFADSVRQIVKYGKPDESTVVSFDSKMDRLFKECRGQRNFYITGFALFLMLIIRRLVGILSEYATLNANYDAVLKQANSANAELTRRLKNESKESKLSGVCSKEEYATLEKELRKSRIDFEALKKQAEATNSEYDRLSSEYQKLQNELEASDSKQHKKEA